MRTEQYIAVSYEREKQRILQELEDVIPALSLEKGIIEQQAKIKMHDSLEIVRESGHLCLIHFNCSGNIYLYLNDTGWNRQRCLASCEGGKDFHLKIEDDALNVQHLRFLKKLHPKTFPEHLRAAGKKYLLD